VADQVTLTVDGQLYEGWVEASVERSLDRFAHSFRLTYIDRWSEKVEPWPIRAGAACQLKYGNHLLVTGFVSTTTFRINERGWELNAGGRSKTGDLCDCSAIHGTGHWNNKNALEIARDLVRPYDLSVERSTPDREPVRTFSIEEGESVQSALDRLCKNRGYLLHTTADGNVGMIQLLSFVGVVGKVPVNESIEREYFEDEQDRFSEYLLRSQASAESDEDDSTTTVLRKVDGVTDPEVARHRPLVVVADSNANRAELERRAKWERNVRAGRSLRVRYKFPGVLDERGFTWTPGDHHLVQDEALGIDEELLLTSATIDVSDKSLTTEVEFTRPQAYSLLDWPDSILNVVTKQGRPKVKKARIIDQQR
jgi:prophage tail gpP-like protein